MKKKKNFLKFSFFCRFSVNVKFNNNSLIFLYTYEWKFYQLFFFLKKKKCKNNNYHSSGSQIVMHLGKKNTEYKKKKLLNIKLKIFLKNNCLKCIIDENFQKNLYMLTKLRIFLYFLCKKIVLYQLKN